MITRATTRWWLIIPAIYTKNDGFFHDDNGNAQNEPYKGLGIEYNLLNLPNVITNNQHEHINYSYTFDGTKLRQTVEDNGILTKVDYCGPFVYETMSGVRSLKYFLTPEGRAVKICTNCY